MAIGIGIGLGMLLAGAIGGGTAIAGAKIQSKAAKRAGAEAAKANEDALAFEREQADRDEREFIETQRENTRRYEQARAEEQRRYITEMTRIDRLEAKEEARFQGEEKRKEPYRQASKAAMADIARRAGIILRPSGPPEAGPPEETRLPAAPPPTVLPERGSFADYTRRVA